MGGQRTWIQHSSRCLSSLSFRQCPFVLSCHLIEILIRFVTGSGPLVLSVVSHFCLTPVGLLNVRRDSADHGGCQSCPSQSVSVNPLMVPHRQLTSDWHQNALCIERVEVFK